MLEDRKTFDLEAVCERLTRHWEIDASVNQSGGGIATIYAGRVTDDRYECIAGPGWFANKGKAYGEFNEFCYGADDDGVSTTTYVTDGTADTVADAIAAFIARARMAVKPPIRIEIAVTIDAPYPEGLAYEAACDAVVQTATAAVEKAVADAKMTLVGTGVGCAMTTEDLGYAYRHGDLTLHELNAITGGDCTCPRRGCRDALEYESRVNDAQNAGPVAYYRFLRAEGTPALAAWTEAQRTCAPPLWKARFCQGCGGNLAADNSGLCDSCMRPPLWKHGSAWDDGPDWGPPEIYF